jgi:hypothetical protein
MAVPSNTPTLVFLLMTPLIAWRLYARVRRMVGRQKSSAPRHWFTVCFFPLLLVLLGATVALHDDGLFSLLGMAAGLACGVGLALYGLKLTRFEVTDEGFFYTPNAHIGIALSALFIGRLLYRYIQIYLAGAPVAGGPPANQFVNSPLTLAIVGMLAGYYVAYAIGLLRWRHQAQARRGSSPA